MIYPSGAFDRYPHHYKHFSHPQIKRALDYLVEKERMGLLGQIILHTKRMTKYHRVRLTNISPTIWQKVIEPGLNQIVNVRHVDMFDTLNHGHCIDIGMEKKWSD